MPTIKIRDILKFHADRRKDITSHMMSFYRKNILSETYRLRTSLIKKNIKALHAHKRLN